MTVALKNTEEKWLKDLYGQEYEEYLDSDLKKEGFGIRQHLDME